MSPLGRAFVLLLLLSTALGTSGSSVATATLSLSVYDGIGFPIAGANVSVGLWSNFYFGTDAFGNPGMFLSQNERQYRATTNAFGEAKIVGLPPGTYGVQVDAGKTSTSAEVALSGGEDRTLDVTFAQQVSDAVQLPDGQWSSPAGGSLPRVRDSIIAVYNAKHPVHRSGTPYFGRYTYVILRTGSPSSLALVSALIAGYAPNGAVALGPIEGLNNPLGYNLFALPVNNSPQSVKDGTPVAARIVTKYDWTTAMNIRDRYCDAAQHRDRSLCRPPYDDGPILLTFLRPLDNITPGTPLPPALAYDLSGISDQQMTATLETLAKTVTIPEPITNDQLLSPPLSVKYIAPLLATITNALQQSIPALKTFVDSGLVENPVEKLDQTKHPPSSRSKHRPTGV